MDLGRLKILGSSRGNRTFQRWLDSEKVLTDNDSFIPRTDVDSILLHGLKNPVEIFPRFATHFEVGLYLERTQAPMHPDEQGPFAPRILAAFVKGKYVEGEAVGYPSIAIRLPEPRLLVQRARPSGGVIQLLGLEGLRRWQEPHLIYIPVLNDQTFLFVCDQADPLQRTMAEKAYRLVNAALKGVHS